MTAEIAPRHSADLVRRIARDQVVDLLLKAAGDDHRTVGAAETEAWAAAAEIGGWTYPEAVEAIRHHQATNTAYLKASHITEWIKSQRRRSRLPQGGINPDGTKVVTLAGACAVWRNAFRHTGPNPTDEQEARVSALLEQMLDGAGDPLTILDAAVLAGLRMTTRIDWILERVASRKDVAARVAPAEYVPNDQLDERFALNADDFDLAWKHYNPLHDLNLSKYDLEDYLPNFRMWNATGRIPEMVHTPRELPDWVVEHISDMRSRAHYSGQLLEHDLSDDELVEDGKRHKAERARVCAWLRSDHEAWACERLAVIRKWHMAHPYDRAAALVKAHDENRDPHTGRYFER